MILRIRTILDVNDDVIRDIEITENSKLVDLHNMIIKSYGFLGKEMASFYRTDKNWQQGDEMPLVDVGLDKMWAWANHQPTQERFVWKKYELDKGIYKFWKNDNKDYLLIKYENLLMNTEKELRRIIIFLEKFMTIKTSYNKNKNIIESTKFENLQSMENKGQFTENAQLTPSLKKKFFYLGPENKWENTLEKNIKEEIENHFSEEMKDLGYL